jgi:hypothetical protein
MFGASPEIVLQEPEGEYDPHGLGEGSYDPYGSVEMGGNIDDQKEMEERMGLLVVDKNEEEEQGQSFPLLPASLLLWMAPLV